MRTSPAPLHSVLLALGLGLAACDAGQEPGAADASGADPRRATTGDAVARTAATGPLDVRVLDIVAGLRPVVSDATSDVREQWLVRRRALLAEMPTAGPEVGAALLDHLAAHPEYNDALRRDLLEAGALASGPTASAEVLELVQTYAGNRLGRDLGLRGRAAVVLGKSDPALAFEQLGRLLTTESEGVTLPPAERLLEGFMEAAERTGEDPVRVLADIATALRMEQAARHRAIEALGDHEGPLVRAALIQVLTESTGNTYMRIKAGQAVARAFEPAEAIPLLEGVLDVEADTRMQAFLLDVLRTLEP